VAEPEVEFSEFAGLISLKSFLQLVKIAVLPNINNDAANSLKGVFFILIGLNFNPKLSLKFEM
jgi:hypothetical protein